MKLWELHELVSAVCLIHGVNSEGVIHFDEVATTEEQVAAIALVEEYLPTLEE